MPWKECDKVSERTKFVGRLLAGERMSDLCREFGISRVTGHKIFRRYKDEGLLSLNDRSSRPWKLANQTPVPIERTILEIKDRYPTWGAPKILAFMQKKSAYEKLPVRSTVHAILDRHGLVKRRRKNQNYRAEGTSLSNVTASNQLWCADYKGQFKMGNGRYCYPLTVTDQHSRYLLKCEALESSKESNTIETFKNVFREYGMPLSIRTDNGAPFGTRTLFGLSKLTILWLRLGIRIERIKPGHPEQNGRHERMHRTMKQAVTKPAGANLLQQQEMLDHFQRMFNEERPHEALEMKCPAEVYEQSLRAYPRVIEDYIYPSNCTPRRVCADGSLKTKGGRKIFISEVFAGQEMGLEELEDEVIAVRFMSYPLGYFGPETCRFYPGGNPFLAMVDQKT